MSLEIKLENPHSPICQGLIEALSAEMSAIYGGSGEGNFSPSDVDMGRAGFAVAWIDNSPVGCGALRPTEHHHTAEIKRMYVMPDARGQGISRQILTFLESTARGLGYTRLILETGIPQTAAIGLYESSGFERMTCYGEYINDSQSVCYEKILTPT